jgi:hypothetical protein
MTFQTELTEEQKLAITTFTLWEDTKQARLHKEQTNKAIYIGLIVASIAGIFALTDGVLSGIIGFIITFALTAGVLLPEKDSQWRS